MKKIPFQQVEEQVNRLYEREFPDGTSNREIEEYCESIAAFVETCGWTVDDYLHETFREFMEPDISRLN